VRSVDMQAFFDFLSVGCIRGLKAFDPFFLQLCIRLLLPVGGECKADLCLDLRSFAVGVRVCPMDMSESFLLSLHFR